MDIHPGELVIGAMMAAFAVIGLFLAGRGLDLEMHVFGLSLTVFSIAFVFGQIRRHFNALDSARAPAGTPPAGSRHD
ncbi:MAG TPA: hypothetical protein VKS60_01045 [Stellaceae bacterium]|nr:hypothetical protein [Stellaceae bacterium]